MSTANTVETIIVRIKNIIPFKVKTFMEKTARVHTGSNSLFRRPDRNFRVFWDGGKKHELGGGLVKLRQNPPGKTRLADKN